MSFYKVYKLDASGAVLKTTLVEARDDAEALQKLNAMGKFGDMELWDRTRLLGRTDFSFAPNSRMPASFEPHVRDATAT